MWRYQLRPFRLLERNPELARLALKLPLSPEDVLTQAGVELTEQVAVRKMEPVEALAA